MEARKGTVNVSDPDGGGGFHTTLIPSKPANPNPTRTLIKTDFSFKL